MNEVLVFHYQEMDDDVSINLQIAKQNDDFILPARVGKVVFMCMDTGWTANVDSCPEVIPFEKRLYLRGDWTPEDKNILPVTFASIADKEQFLLFLKNLTSHFNKGSHSLKPTEFAKVHKPSKFIKLDLDSIKDKKQKKYAERLSSDGRLVELVAYLRSLEGQKSPYKFDVNASRKVKGKDKMAEKKDGFYIKLYNKRFDIFASHVPSNSELGFGNYLGIEIECLIPRTAKYRNSNQFANWMQSNNHKIKYCSAGEDGSLRPAEGFFGIEFRLLTMKNDFSNLKQLCDLLAEVGAKVNKSCGLHVHLDMRVRASKDEEIELLNLKARRIGNSLNVLKLMIPSSRRQNSFCKLSVGKLDSNDRYYAVNKSSYHKHKTMEIRLHSGTTSFEKIYNWSNLLLAIADCKKLTRKKVSTVEEFFELLNPSQDLKDYVVSRIKTFETPQDSDVQESDTPVETPQGRSWIPVQPSPLTPSQGIAIDYSNGAPSIVTFPHQTVQSVSINGGILGNVSEQQMIDLNRRVSNVPSLSGVIRVPSTSKQATNSFSIMFNSSPSFQENNYQ